MSSVNESLTFVFAVCKSLCLFFRVFVHRLGHQYDVEKKGESKHFALILLLVRMQ